MYRLENQILDIYDDVNLKESIRELAPSIPGHLKTAAAPSMESQASKPNEAFALCLVTKHANLLRRYPVDNPVDAFFSAQYLAKHAHKLPTGAVKTASAHVYRACNHYGLKVPELIKQAAVQARAESLAGNTYHERMQEPLGFTTTLNESLLMKAAAAEVPLGDAAFEDSPYFFAITKTANGKRVDARYAMPNPEFVKKAADYLTKHANSFTPAERHQFAHNVCMRAQELGCIAVANDPTLQKYAGLGGYGSGVRTQLELRKQACKDDTRRETFDKLLTKQASIKPAEFAQTLAELDKRAGLEKYYGGFLQDPYAATYAGAVEATLAKQAAAHSVDMTNNHKRALVESHFGKDIADLLAKEGAAAIDALPDDAKEILAAIESGAM